MLMIVTFAINAVMNLAIGILMAKFLGPADFGRYALAQAIGIIFNTIFLDWLRHAVTRFYAEGREDAGRIRATLDVTVAVSCFLICLISAIAIASGVDFKLGIALAIAAPAVGIANGLFDFSTAMLRANFQDRPYAKAVLLKNLLSLILMLAGAAIFNSAALALAGMCLSILVSLLSVRHSLGLAQGGLKNASLPYLRNFVLYAWPIVISNIFIQATTLFDRDYLIRTQGGFEASGQYSFAFDMGIRIIAALGSAFDILLVQLAIRADHEAGIEAAKKQLSQNMGIVFAIMTPLCAGLWLILPSFAALFVPEAFRQPFMQIFSAILPGLFAYGLLLFALHQVFFIAKQTWPLFFTSGTVIAINLLGVWASGTSDPAVIAQIQGAGFIGGFIVGCLFIFWLYPVAPRLWDLGSSLVALAAMVLATLPFRTWEPGIVPLLAAAICGAIVYAGIVLAFNTAGFRVMLGKGFRKN